MRRRRVIRVLEDRDVDGTITPVVVYYGDRKFIVDKVIDVQRRAATMAGGYGLRYTVLLSCDEEEIHRQGTYLFLEIGADPEIWFVEEKVRE